MSVTISHLFKTWLTSNLLYSHELALNEKYPARHWPREDAYRPVGSWRVAGNPGTLEGDDMSVCSGEMGNDHV